MATPLFQSYMAMPQLAPTWLWRTLRWLMGGCTLGLVVLAVVNPPLALLLFWGVFVPAFPLAALVAPGLWRNVCPLASVNQIPRTLGFTRGLTVPPSVQRFAPLISAGLFLIIVPLRPVLLDHSGPALAVFILGLLGLAFWGGGEPRAAPRLTP